jgi:hypothetical protein
MLHVTIINWQSADFIQKFVFFNLLAYLPVWLVQFTAESTPMQPFW